MKPQKKMHVLYSETPDDFIYPEGVFTTKKLANARKKELKQKPYMKYTSFDTETFEVNFLENSENK